MQLQQDAHTGKFQIKSYKPGELNINNQLYHHSVIISLNYLSEWTVKRFDELTADHWQVITELQPEIVILGTGEQIHFPTPELLAPLYEKQIGIEFMDTAAACRTFEVLASEGRNVVAALIIDANY